MLCLSSCGGDTGVTPTQNPTPVPLPEPTPTPLPDYLQQDTYCVPKPPPVYAVRVKIHSDRGYKKILDARAVVGPDKGYCAAIGQPGATCVVRVEDDPMAVTCNNLVMGRADTGRYGPNWFFNDLPCRAAGEGSNDPGCRNHETNQFLVYTFGPGVYAACSESAVCAQIEIH